MVEGGGGIEHRLGGVRRTRHTEARGDPGQLRQASRTMTAHELAPDAGVTEY